MYYSVPSRREVTRPADAMVVTRIRSPSIPSALLDHAVERHLTVGDHPDRTTQVERLGRYQEREFPNAISVDGHGVAGPDGSYHAAVTVKGEPGEPPPDPGLPRSGPARRSPPSAPDCSGPSAP